MGFQYFTHYFTRLFTKSIQRAHRLSLPIFAALLIVLDFFLPVCNHLSPGNEYYYDIIMMLFQNGKKFPPVVLAS